MHVWLIIIMLCLAPVQVAAAQSQESDKSGGGKGLTLEDIGRGLKSAVQNIEKEIPKIGPAIVDTAKKLTGKDAKDRGSNEEAPKK